MSKLINEEMNDLAKALSSEYPELDGTFATLNKLEALVRKSKSEWNAAHQKKFGAYYGEVIRTAVTNAEWVDYESAQSLVNEMEWGPDIDRILRLKGELLFPLVKVQKFQKNGPSDSLVAFGRVAVTLLQANWKEDEVVDPSQFNEDEKLLSNLIEEFIKGPSEESLRNLREVQGNLNAVKIKWFLSQQVVEANVFTQFFNLDDEGRGRNKYMPSFVAAEWLWMALEAGAVQNEAAMAKLEKLLTSKDKLTRSRSAWVYTRCALNYEDVESLETLFSGADAIVNASIIKALVFHCRTSEDIVKYRGLIFMAVEGPVPVRKALEAVFRFSARTGSLEVVSSVVTTALKSEKAEEVQTYIEVVKDQVYQVLHRKIQYYDMLAEWLPAVVGHLEPIPGNTAVPLTPR